MGEILINQLFAGAYLQEGTNIGHEVINLFRDDNDENYLYITPMGNVKGHNVDKVLFVQNIAGRETMEVVMKAEGLSNTSADDVQKIFYAGVNITDIFNKNLYHGEAETSKTNSMATYCAKDVRFPKKGKRIIITVDSSYEVEDEKNTVVIRLDCNKKKIVGQSMRTYLSEELYPSIHAKIEELLANTSLWEESNNTQKMISDGSYTRTNISFLEIIRNSSNRISMTHPHLRLLTHSFKQYIIFAERSQMSTSILTRSGRFHFSAIGV